MQHLNPRVQVKSANNQGNSVLAAIVSHRHLFRGGSGGDSRPAGTQFPRFARPPLPRSRFPTPLLLPPALFPFFVLARARRARLASAASRAFRSISIFDPGARLHP